MPAPPFNSQVARKYAPPYPNLQTYPLSGAMKSIPWAEVASFDMSCGEDGVSLGMAIMVYWQDLSYALQAILGYTYLSSGQPNRLLRVLPWQNPKYSQLWAHSVTRVEGRRFEGFSQLENFVAIGPGAGGTADIGPSADYNLAIITIKFWRPPYAVRSDADVLNAGNGKYYEWLRYTDRQWNVESQYLTGGANFMQWAGQADGTGGGTTQNWKCGTDTLPSPYGITVSHARVSRKWYQIPEAAIFKANAQDGTPTGMPFNFFYTQTSCQNPITGFLYLSGNPIPGCVNNPIGGDPWNGNAKIAANLDSVLANQFLGMPMGTLRFENAEITPRPLQLPAWLMLIPAIANNEALSQVQYDVIFHFDFCDPPRGYDKPTGLVQQYFRGHNIFPFAADGQFYPLQTQAAIGPTGKGTAYHYADFSDLFTPLTISVATQPGPNG